MRTYEQILKKRDELLEQGNVLTKKETSTMKEKTEDMITLAKINGQLSILGWLLEGHTK